MARRFRNASVAASSTWPSPAGRRSPIRKPTSSGRETGRWSGRGRARALDVEEGIAQPPRRIVPESLYRGQPRTDGQELVVLDSGHEGRVWRDNVLAASHWWPGVPALQDWNEFRRGAGLPPADAVPEPMPYPLADYPWSAQTGKGVAESLVHYRSKMLLVAVGVATAALSALLVGVLALKISIWQIDRRIAAQEQALGRIIDARDRALATQQAIKDELALRPPAGQIELLALVSGLLQGEWQLLEWKMPDAQTLQATIRMPNGDPRRVVTALENSKRFTEVTADIGRQRDTMLVKAKVVRAPAAGGRK